MLRRARLPMIPGVADPLVTLVLGVRQIPAAQAAQTAVGAGPEAP